MQAIFLVAPQSVAVQAGIGMPACPPDGVLIQTRAGGVCGGDLKKYRHSAGPFPVFMGGHEYAGEVVDVGSQAAVFRPGDHVVRCFNDFCGLCVNCRLGSPNFCTGNPRLTGAGGGFAEYLATRSPARGSGLFRKPDDLSFVDAATCEPATCAIGAVLRGQPEPGQWAAVVGLGPIGHFIAQTLFAMGVRVIGIDVSQQRLTAARPFCLAQVDSMKDDPVGSVREITGGVGADRAYEAVGIEPTLAAALRMTRMSGITVLAGVFGAPMTGFDPEWLFRRDLTLIAAKGTRPLTTAQGQALVLDYIERRIIRPETAVMAFPLSRAAEAFSAQAAADCLKAVIVPD